MGSCGLCGGATKDVPYREPPIFAATEEVEIVASKEVRQWWERWPLIAAAIGFTVGGSSALMGADMHHPQLFHFGIGLTALIVASPILYYVIIRDW